MLLEPKIQYLRLERTATDSFITYKLPEPMEFEDACKLMEGTMKGWFVCTGSMKNPDEEEV